jgi:Threonyl and Alanyl tRNA synthetase second additional domain
MRRDPESAITIYHIGSPGEKEHWWDLCAGPHVASTGAIDPAAVELERTAGAYWRGDESQAMLTRVYGTAWASAVQLEAYRHMQAEAAKRDHRKLGTQLNLFSIQVREASRIQSPGGDTGCATIVDGSGRKAERGKLRHHLGLEKLRMKLAIDVRWHVAGGGRRRPRVLVAQGRRDAQCHRDILEGAAPCARLRPALYAARCEGGPLEDKWAL